MTDDTIATPLPPGVRSDVASFYRAVWASATSAAVRYRLAIVLEIVLIVAWFVIRTMFEVDGRAYLAWVTIVGAVALIAPRSGLVVFIATSAFFEPDSLARTLGPRELIVIPLAAGVAVQVALDRLRWRPGAAVLLAIALAAGTALGVVHAFVRFDDPVAWHAARSWLGNMLAPVILLVAAAWSARDGSVRPLVVAVGVAVVVSIVCLVEYAAPGSVSKGPFEWVGFWKTFNGRLAGTIPSPNALSAQLIIPTAVLVAAVLMARDVRLRILALVAALPLLLAHYLTFSRSPLLGGYVFAVVLAWRIRRAFGIVALAAGLVGAALFLPTYLQLRSQSALEGAVTPGSILVASDAYRFRAWGAAADMWIDAPLTGQGYLAYKELADAFGDPALGSPHNEWLRLFAEEGLGVGLIGLLFIAATIRSLARVPGWLGTGLLGGFAAYVVAATFNNPFLFLRVSAIAFPLIGVGLALAARARAPTVDAPTDDGSAVESATPATVH